ncbi:hypothetical protein STEG23_024044 [Scotinomys teguina]
MPRCVKGEHQDSATFKTLHHKKGTPSLLVMQLLTHRCYSALVIEPRGYKHPQVLPAIHVDDTFLTFLINSNAFPLGLYTLTFSSTMEHQNGEPT